MKKLLEIVIKVILFFTGWVVCVSMIPIPETSNPAIWRLWAELIPLLVVIILSLLFVFKEINSFSLHLFNAPFKNSLIGVVSGLLWLGATAGILAICGVLRIEGRSYVSLIGVWLLSAFLNTIMQELLVRGYIYQLVKQRYNLATATIVSTLLFTLLHGGAFEAGIVPVLNVFTMSLFMTVVLEFTQSLLAPTIIHFLWNGIGAIILGGVSLAEDYPHVFQMSFHGNTLLSGGIYKMEGSIIVLLLNIFFISCFFYALRKKNQ